MAFFYIFLFVLLTNTSSLSYRRYSLSSLCQFRRSVAYNDTFDMNKQIATIELRDSPSMSSVLIEQVWTNSSYKHFFCQFRVATQSKWLHGPSSGLFVAIRELKFRKNEIGECTDYVIFEINDKNPRSHKVCGTVSGDEDLHDLKNYYEIPEGFIKVIVHIDNHNFEGNDIIIKLTVTAFEDCNGAYKFRCLNHRCISDSLYDDLIINCIPPLCRDEPRFHGKCGTKPTYHTPNTHILAVGSSLVLLVLVVAVAWYCLKVFVNFFRYREAANIVQVVTAPHVEYQTVYVPSATDETTAETQLNEDDPPSYDSLFK